MNGAGTWYGKYGIIRCQIFLSLRQYHAYLCCLFRAVRSGAQAGLGADGYSHMLVADLGRSGSFSKVFRIYGAASWVVIADAGYCPFAGFAADFGRFHAVWNGKSGIRKPLMDTVHDIAPDIRYGKTVPPFPDREFLIAVTAAPDTGCIVGSKTYKPDIDYFRW
mgnify:FL=1